MRKSSILILGFFILVLLSSLGSGTTVSQAQAVQNLSASGPASPTLPKVNADFGKMPISFIPNQGQVNGSAAFYVQGKDKTVYFSPDGLTFVLTEAVAAERRLNQIGPPADIPLKENKSSKRWNLKLDFVGANPQAQPVGQDKTGAVVSYFKGKPKDWHTGLPSYSKIVYPNLWPGIDLVYYGTVNKLKYDFIVHPGADPSQIKLAYRGASGVAVNGEGRLEVSTPLGGFSDDTPVAYQQVGEKRANVPMAYKMDKARPGDLSPAYGFQVGDYDRTQTLILDPAVIIYCGYIGGSSSETVYGIAVDDAGCVYVVGMTPSTETTFPVRVGPDLTHNDDGSNDDAFVAKIKADGTELIYCGYIGGSGEDGGYGIKVDGSGNAYVAGMTTSTEATFPVTVGPDLTYNDDGSYADAFVAKIKADGTGLDYCGYIGGSNSEIAQGLALDSLGCAYVAGRTYSSDGSFPVTVGPDLTYNGGSCDGFVAKVKADGTELVYCGYIGGSSWDGCKGIAVDSSGNAYVSGYTSSTEATFPVTVGPDLTCNGAQDVFVAKVKADGTGLVYCGYIGGASSDSVGFIAIDSLGCAYVAGTTTSTEATFPVLVGPDLTYNGGSGSAGSYGDAFVAKVKADGTGLDYCGYIGGSGDDYASGIAVNSSGNAFIAGYTPSTEATFPVINGPDSTYNGGASDAFAAKVKADGTGLDYCGYIGGSDQDRAWAIAIDDDSNIYVSADTHSTEATFPVKIGPDLTFNGSSDADAWVAKISWVLEADIAMTKSSDNLTPEPGAEFNFTVTAKNNGPNEATGLKVTDQLPTGLGYVSSSPSQGTYDSGTGVWDIGSLAKDATVTLTLKASADGSGEITNTASVSALNESDPEDSNDSASATVNVTAAIAVATNPTGQAITVDGTFYTAPQSFNWTPGSVHTIGVSSPQSGTTGTQYFFGSWSDGGAQNHSITTPSTDTTYTATFSTEYTLTTSANPAAGGTVTPSGANWYDKNQSVQVQAAAKTGYVFTGWSGDLSGTTNPATVAMSGPKSVTASFISGKTLNPPVLSQPTTNSTGQPTSVTLKWVDTNSSPQELKYKVRIKKAGGAYANITLAANTIQYIKSGLVPGAVYYWNVQALGNGTTIKNSLWANGQVDFNFTVAPPVTLNAPTLVAPVSGATGQPTSLTLQWVDTNSSPQELNYKVRIKPAGGAYKTYTVAANAVSYLKSGLVRNKVYYWSVQAKGNGTSTKDSAFPADWKFTTAL